MYQEVHYIFFHYFLNIMIMSIGVVQAVTFLISEGIEVTQLNNKCKLLKNVIHIRSHVYIFSFNH